MNTRTKFCIATKNVRNNVRHWLKLRIWGKIATNTFILVIDPELKHPGLADRFKAIVNCYNIAKLNGYNFKIIFKHPFALEDYLVPNDIDWIADFSDLHYVLSKTRFFNELDFITEDSWKGRIELKKDKEYHCYSYVGNRQPDIFPESGCKWHDLFHELFKPSDRLEQKLQECGFPEKSYIAVHIRFVNALENFEKVSCCDNAINTEKQKDDLIARCQKGILRIKEQNKDCDILVFSDSKRFLESIKHMPVKTLPTNNIGHISFGTNADMTMKTFIDLYMISRAKKVYRIDAPELYAWSGFAVTAAKIGGIEFLTEKV